ncbi:MAG TPA: pectinesterase family protein, partial [Sphingobacterium sp.]|nr:pectinesterase family protein [Sphingobacterium sp.]
MGICKSLLVLLLGCILMTGYSQTTDNRYELVVAQDGSGDHSTIQAAVNAVRDHAERRVVIHIKAGVYEEKVVIPSFKRNITLRGEDRDRTIIRYDDYSGKPYKGIDVTGNPDY